MVIEFHPNGTDGSTINTMTNHFQIAIHSKTLSSRSLINGSSQLQLSDFMFQEQLQFIQSFWNTENSDKTSSQRNGLQLPKELDLNKVNISFTKIYSFIFSNLTMNWNFVNMYDMDQTIT